MTCGRCDSDLTLVRQAYEAATLLQSRAREHLVNGAVDDAVREAYAAVRMVDTDSTRKTLLAALVFRRGARTS